MRVRSSVLINRPIHEVFAYAADYRNDPHWRSEVREIRYVPDGPVAVGTHAIETSVLFGRRVVTESVITVYDTDRQVDFEYLSGPFRVLGSRTFEAVDGGTRLTSELEWTPSGHAARMFAGVLRSSYQRTLDRYLARLRTILEDGRRA